MKIEELKQENEALKISLESSERIYKQQKELISMLQRSQSIAETSIASVNVIFLIWDIMMMIIVLNSLKQVNNESDEQ